MLKRLLVTFFMLIFAVEGYTQSFEFYKGDTINRVDESGRKQGKWIIFNSEQTRILEEGTYKNNKKTGVWKKYYANGNIQSQITYEKGNPEGKTKIYYRNGNLSEEGNWQGDRWVGDYKFYHKNGNPAYVWHYNSEGKRTGTQKYYYADGSLKIKGAWDDGEKNGEIKEFYKNGALKSQMVYNEGAVEEGSRKTFEKQENDDRESNAITTADATKKEKQEKVEIFDGTGYNEIYNINKKLIQKGHFVEGELQDGEKYIYNSDGDKIRTIIIKNGETQKVINH